jgi:hypothetical protein
MFSDIPRLTVNCSPDGPRWIVSVAPYQNWRVCGLSDLILVESLLPQAQQAEIKRLAASTPAIEKPKKPLLGKWVPAQLHANSMLLPCKSGRLELYRPADVPAGWYWLGSTTSSTSALIVRANDGITDAFCPIVKYDSVWDDKGSIRDTSEIAFFGALLGLRAGAYSLWAPYPQDASKYAAMTGGFVGDHAPRAQPQPPALDAGLVCINKKYLAKAKKGEKVCCCLIMFSMKVVERLDRFGATREAVPSWMVRCITSYVSIVQRPACALT